MEGEHWWGRTVFLCQWSCTFAMLVYLESSADTCDIEYSQTFAKWPPSGNNINGHS